MATDANSARLARLRAAWPLLLCISLIVPQPLAAADLYDGHGIGLRWDTTLRYSFMFRLGGRDPALVANPNADDGDRNFEPGLVSDRLDAFSQADLTYGSFGVRLSGAGWYDSIYGERNDNDSAATFNPLSVPHNEFTSATRRLHGEDADLLDAYLHGSVSFSGMPLSFRLGRHSLLWGESLFFAENGIAAGQGPVDVIKALGNPQAETAEVLLPVAQASIDVLPTTDMAIDLYYQFEWRKNRLPAEGSYFSEVDILDEGGERLLLANGSWFARAGDIRPPGSGQFGAALRVTKADYSYGFYALRFDSKSPEVYLRPDGSSGQGDIGSYQLVYPRNIEIYGASFSSYLDDNNLAGEVSFRRRMPLVSNAVVVPSGVVADAEEHPLYAIGDTLHAQISAIGVFGASRFWDAADLAVEFAASDILEVARNKAAFSPDRSNFALSVEANFDPRFFEVLPNLDIALPIGFACGLAGNSGINEGQNANAGNVQIGLEADFRTVWEGRLTYTRFFGSPERQPLADRDFISVSIQRTF
jgi:hypothetical protein